MSSLRHFITRISTGLILATIFFGSYALSSHLFTALLLVGFGEILIFEWPRLASKNKYLWFLVPAYPTIPLACLIYLNYFYRSVDILVPIYPFLVCAVADTSAYIFGKTIGKHKIWPRVSPKKTWEGLFGSILGVVLLNLILFYVRPGLISALLLEGRVCASGVILALLAFYGDMFESYLKRRAGIKDSGNLLPGHGGLLDRADSAFFVVVALVAWLSQAWMTWRIKRIAKNNGIMTLNVAK